MSEGSAAQADARAGETEAKMTDEERFSLLVSVMGANSWLPVRDGRLPDDVPMSAGYVPGVPRLGVPALLMSDASLGVTNPGYRPGDTATALPAGIALGASFNPALARAAGAMIGREARSRGFNVLLAGGINLARDPRNGRNFEYLSEDPLLSAVARRRGDQRDPGRGRDLDPQALLAQLQRDEPALAGRDHRPGRAPRVRPAGVRDRDRALATRVDHDAATTRSTASTPAATASCSRRCSRAPGATGAG